MKKIIGWFLLAAFLICGFTLVAILGGIWAVVCILIASAIGTGIGVVCAYLIGS